jgi:hypothetical protein
VNRDVSAVAVVVGNAVRLLCRRLELRVGETVERLAGAQPPRRRDDRADARLTADAFGDGHQVAVHQAQGTKRVRVRAHLGVDIARGAGR